MSFVLGCEDGFYKHMEDGRAVVGYRDIPEFDEDTANIILRQLPSFHGGDWRAIKPLNPAALLIRCKTQAEIAKQLGCSAGYVSQWVRKDKIPLTYLRAAMLLYANTPEPVKA